MRQNATDLEMTLVRQTLSIVAETAPQYSCLAPTNLKWHPLPYFGPVSAAKVITLGLNPSAHEFKSDRHWPTHIEPSQLANRLFNYFSCDYPSPHPWFGPWAAVLSEMGFCYSRDAAHIDLSPRPTNSKRSSVEDLFAQMLQTDAAIWIEALSRATNCKLVLAAGSVTKGYYLNEFILRKLGPAGARLAGDWRRGKGKGQTALQRIILPNGREIPFFFCSTGPSRNGGPTLVSTCRANMRDLERLCSDAGRSQKAFC